MAHRHAQAALTACLMAAWLALGCQRQESPEVTLAQLRQHTAGLSAMPTGVVAVLRIDVPVVAASPVALAVAKMFLARQARATTAVARLAGPCGGNVHWLGELVIGIAARQANGTYPTVIAIDSLLPADAFSACLEALLGTPRRPGVISSPQGGEPVVTLGDGTATTWLVPTGAGTRGSQWLLANHEGLMVEALAAARGGANVLSNNQLAPQLVSAGQGNLPVWAAGLVPRGFASRMRELTSDRVGAGPSSFVLRVGLREGLSVHLLAKLSSIADANELKILVNSEIGTLAMAAQRWGLGPYVSSVAVEAAGPMLILKAAYSAQEVQELLAAIDKQGSNQQDAPPTLGAPLSSP